MRGIGRHHLEQLSRISRAEIAGVADLDADASRQAGEQWQATPLPTLEAMISAVGVDAVILATPHHLHAPMSLSALSAGVHVYVEKPIANRVS
ncbi:MAG: Gfo/Idh/MocA family oxidoreductase, partial [Candidatus Latescibacterota bacterium]|nr:Gfo/Idh/MocA family oxidoreductase [Candidatus Latescibacterota bacterium]